MFWASIFPWGGTVRGWPPKKGMRSFLFAAVPATEPGNKKPRGQRWKEPLGEEPVRKKRGRPMTKNLDPDPGEGEARGRHGLWPQCSEEIRVSEDGAGPGRRAPAAPEAFSLTVPSRPPFQSPHRQTHPQRLSQHQPRSDTSLMAASLPASSCSSSPTPSSGAQTARTHPKTGKRQKEAFPRQRAPLQVSPPEREAQ